MEELAAALLLLLYTCRLELLDEVEATLVELVNAVEDDVLLGEELSVYVMVYVAVSTYGWSEVVCVQVVVTTPFVVSAR